MSRERKGPGCRRDRGLHVGSETPEETDIPRPDAIGQWRQRPGGSRPTRNLTAPALLVAVYPIQTPLLFLVWDAGGPGRRATAGAFLNPPPLGHSDQWLHKRGQKLGTQRGNRQRFPYEPRVIGGKLMMPAELQAIHRYVIETPVLENVTEEIE